MPPVISAMRFAATRLNKKLIAVVISAAAAAPVGLSCRQGCGAVVVVSDGSVESNTVASIYDALEVYGTDGQGHRSTYDALAPLDISEDLRVHDAGVFNGEADVTCGSGASAYWGGTIHLRAGTLTAVAIDADGATAVTRSGGHYATEALSLASGAMLSYGAGDSILYDVSLSTGASLTLARDLTIAGHITLDGAATSLDSAGYAITAGYLDVGSSAIISLDQNLSLSAGALYVYSGGAIVRTVQTISAPSFFIENATLDLLAGDIFDLAEFSTIGSGGSINAPAGASIGHLDVFGVNRDGVRATFNVSGDATVTSVAVAADGFLNLIDGTLFTPSLSLDGVGSAGQTRGHYAVTKLSLAGGATLAFGLGDGVDSLFVSDAGSRLDELAPLTLSSLTILNGGNLHLGAFTGTGAIANWGLRMAGDDTSFLENLIVAGLITGGPSPLQVIFDPVSTMTYVATTPAAVPEIAPTTTHGAVMLLVGAAGLLERRLRRAALPRQAS